MRTISSPSKAATAVWTGLMLLFSSTGVSQTALGAETPESSTASAPGNAAFGASTQTSVRTVRFSGVLPSAINDAAAYLTAQSRRQCHEQSHQRHHRHPKRHESERNYWLHQRRWKHHNQRCGGRSDRGRRTCCGTGSKWNAERAQHRDG